MYLDTTRGEMRRGETRLPAAGLAAAPVVVTNRLARLARCSTMSDADAVGSGNSRCRTRLLSARRRSMAESIAMAYAQSPALNVVPSSVDAEVPIAVALLVYSVATVAVWACEYRDVA